MSAQAIVVARPDVASLVDSPIRPSWIISGSPVAKVQELSRSTDKTTVTSHWSCTAGTFNWYFGMDETVHILEGEVIVKKPGEAPMTLSAGDVALFRNGTWCVWHVPVSVRKICVCRHSLPVAGGFLLRALKFLGRIFFPVELDNPPGRQEEFEHSHNPNLIKTRYKATEMA